MAEDKNLADNVIHAQVHRTDSDRRLVSTPLPYSCQIGQTNLPANPRSRESNDITHVITANASDTSLSNKFLQMHCNSNQTDESGKNSDSNVKQEYDKSTVRQQEPPDALPSTSRQNYDLTKFSLVTTNSKLPLPEKRKRNSPQTRNVREKLLQYAYTDRSTKNVTFDLQADDEITRDVIMEEGASNSSSTTSLGQNPGAQRSYTNLETALPQRRSREARRQIQQTEGVQTLPTEDQMRNYVVPDSKAAIWKLYEQKLRQVGRSQARMNQLTQEMDEGNPPSWCFGGTQAPQYMRPFHPELVAVTLEYAMKMAVTARNILIRQTEQDAGQARHLQETLMRMYKQDRDPDFDLATGRAEGIADHYTRKETALNIRLSEEDQVNIPTEINEWAEMLCRRKVTKPNTRSRSRSASKDSKKKQRKQTSSAQETASKQLKAGKSTITQKPKTSNKRSNQHSGPSYAQWKASKSSEQNQLPRSSTSNTSNAMGSSSASNLPRGTQTQLTKPAPSTSSKANQFNQRQTALTEEELRLITMLRASKSDK